MFGPSCFAVLLTKPTTEQQRLFVFQLGREPRERALASFGFCLGRLARAGPVVVSQLITAFDVKREFDPSPQLNGYNSKPAQFVIQRYGRRKQFLVDSRFDF